MQWFTTGFGFRMVMLSVLSTNLAWAGPAAELFKTIQTRAPKPWASAGEISQLLLAPVTFDDLPAFLDYLESPEKTTWSLLRDVSSTKIQQLAFGATFSEPAFHRPAPAPLSLLQGPNPAPDKSFSGSTFRSELFTPSYIQLTESLARSKHPGPTTGLDSIPEASLERIIALLNTVDVRQASGQNLKHALVSVLARLDWRVGGRLEKLIALLETAPESVRLTLTVPLVDLFRDPEGWEPGASERVRVELYGLRFKGHPLEKRIRSILIKNVTGESVAGRQLHASDFRSVGDWNAEVARALVRAMELGTQSAAYEIGFQMRQDLTVLQPLELRLAQVIREGLTTDADKIDSRNFLESLNSAGFQFKDERSIAMLRELHSRFAQQYIGANNRAVWEVFAVEKALILAGAQFTPDARAVRFALDMIQLGLRKPQEFAPFSETYLSILTTYLSVGNAQAAEFHQLHEELLQTVCNYTYHVQPGVE